MHVWLVGRGEGAWRRPKRGEDKKSQDTSSTTKKMQRYSVKECVVDSKPAENQCLKRGTRPLKKQGGVCWPGGVRGREKEERVAWQWRGLLAYLEEHWGFGRRCRPRPGTGGRQSHAWLLWLGVESMGWVCSVVGRGTMRRGWSKMGTQRSRIGAGSSCWSRPSTRQMQLGWPEYAGPVCGKCERETSIRSSRENH